MTSSEDPNNELATGLDERAPVSQQELVEHLAELRTRIIRCLAYVAAGTVASWCFYGFFFALLSRPVSSFLARTHSTFLLTSVTEGFVVKMEISVIVGTILAIPLVTWEGWRFLDPALTPREKRGVRLVAPLSLLLFAGGVVLAYVILPVGIQWLTNQRPPGSILMPSVQHTLLFIVKMCLAFGVVFQLPVILMFLGKVGIVNSKMLKSHWRHAVVLCGIVAAVATPSNDAFSMLMMCLPLVLLYLLSIGLVRIVEK
jgi:sec-independent protein translocase protein TatC